MMSTIKANKHGAEYYVGISPGQARPIENSCKPSAYSQQPELDKVTHFQRKPAQLWNCDNEVAWTRLDGGQIVTVDKADLCIVAGKRWREHRTGENTYAATGRADLMHRMIACIAGDGLRVDHRDGNALNNRRHNLRIAPQTYNRANSRKRKAATSNFKGVRLLKNGKWAAAVTKTTDGIKKRDHLGCFACEVEAAMAYNKRALELFGEFACLNVIPVLAERSAA